ncbi:MAG: gamma-glutamyl-gamma-aminobutyrate hydrolase family protein, partial [Chromatiales bacterium]|nr:gamma-glutamyl-gamma-aminobutyrate hydrolase family protein [Chromatiales bacterium]
MSTLHAVVIRHLAFEDLGSFAPLLGSDPWNLSYLEAGVDDLSPAADADLLVVLGGPIGVNEEREYPFLSEELALLEKRLAADRPTLGICLGAQLIAKALGAQVYPGPAKEIGWSPLSLSSSGADSCLAAVDGGLTPVLHWHGDTFDL